MWLGALLGDLLASRVGDCSLNCRSRPGACQEAMLRIVLCSLQHSGQGPSSQALCRSKTQTDCKHPTSHSNSCGCLDDAATSWVVGLQNCVTCNPWSDMLLFSGIRRKASRSGTRGRLDGCCTHSMIPSSHVHLPWDTARKGRLPPLL